MDKFKEELVRRGFEDVRVRMGGGRDMVMLFQSKEIMGERLMRMKVWLKE